MTTASRVAHAHAIIQGRIAAVVASLSPAERDAKHLPEVSIAVPVDVLVTAREALEHQMPRDAFGLPTTLSTPPADDVRRCSNAECPLDYAHDGPCAPKGWTPPADDVRVAVARLSGHVFHGEYFKRPATVVEVSDLRLVLDALTNAEAAREVHP